MRAAFALGVLALISISVAADFDRFARTLHDLRVKQLPFATARALNDTAQLARSEITGAMQTIFDRPIAFTVNSIAVLAASKSNLAATVLVKDQQAKYLLLEETGGTRTAAMNTRKPAAALVLPVAVKLDAYGNIPSGSVARLKRQLTRRLEMERSARKAARKEAGKRERKRPPVEARDKGVFYVSKAKARDNLPAGFYERLAGHRIRHVIGFGSEETYHPRFHFRDRVTKVARDNFRVFLMRRLREATSQ